MLITTIYQYIGNGYLMTKDNLIRDNELLYRRIKDNDDRHQRYSCDEQGKLKKINVICFFDKQHEISMFRAELMNSDPRPCRFCITEGVVGFTASDVRSIEIEGYKVKVCANPEDTADCKHNSDEYFRRIAHAIIYITCVDSNTRHTKKRAFRGLSQALSAKSQSRGWLLKPHS